MFIKIFSNFVSIVKSSTVVLTFCFSLAMVSNAAQAVVIDFDNIAIVHPDPADVHFADYPITDEYVSQGVLISDGYLWEYGSGEKWVVSSPNYLTIGHWMTLTFVGELPTYVSMIVTPNPYAVFIDAYGPSSWSEEKQTTGYAGPFNDTPWAPNQFIFFESVLGISEISLIGWQGSRTSGRMDDLTYHYASVPEPSTLVLFGLGVLGLAWRQRKAFKPE